jgi:hypothetical protein
VGVSVLIDILGFFGDLALDLVPWGADGRRDRRLLREGRARCGIRAASGRVLDIGTEWSVGICTISTGRVDFAPRIGIVGDRDIEVLEVLDSDVDSVGDLELGLGPTVTYVLRTPKGDLYWALPDHIAEQASGLLFGS